MSPSAETTNRNPSNDFKTADSSLTSGTVSSLGNSETVKIII